MVGGLILTGAGETNQPLEYRVTSLINEPQVHADRVIAGCSHLFTSMKLLSLIVLALLALAGWFLFV